MQTAQSLSIRPVTWLPYVSMQYLTDACEIKIVKKGDRLSIPIAGKKYEVEVVAFEPVNEESVQIRKWTEFKVLKKDSMEADHFYDPTVDEEIRQLMGKDYPNAQRYQRTTNK